jgi:hypothetical protein
MQPWFKISAVGLSIGLCALMVGRHCVSRRSQIRAIRSGELRARVHNGNAWSLQATACTEFVQRVQSTFRSGKLTPKFLSSSVRAWQYARFRICQDSRLFGAGRQVWPMCSKAGLQRGSEDSVSKPFLSKLNLLHKEETP